MALDQTAAGLIAAVRSAAYLPVSGGPSDAQILADLNRQQSTYVVPFMVTIGEEFFVSPHLFSTVAGTREYDIPADSIASKIRDVQVLVPGNTSATDAWVSLAQEEPERAAMYSQAGGQPVAYFKQGNQVSLLPAPTTVWSMRLMYYRRPSQIVTSGYQTITGVTPSGSNTVLTTVVSGVLQTAATTAGYDAAGTVPVDVVSLSDPTNLKATNAPAALAATTVTFSDDYDDGVTVTSMYACIAGQSPVSQLPREANELLTLRTAAFQLQKTGDPRMGQAFDECARVKKTLTELFAPRASGRPRKIVNMNGPGWGSSRWTGRGWIGNGN